MTDQTDQTEVVEQCHIFVQVRTKTVSNLVNTFNPTVFKIINNI